MKERVCHIAARDDCDVRVVSPVPYFPPLKAFERWYEFSQIPKHETVGGLSVERPRYYLLPRIGSYYHGRELARAGRKVIDRLRPEFDFDLIDSHFVFPDGVAAARLADRYNKPLVITCRGEDILSFPDLPVVGDQIRQAIQRADALIAVSHEIGEAIATHGGDPEKIHVIPNGVDVDRFRPIDSSQARRDLDLPADRPIILSVGTLMERKGFHLLVDAIPEIRKTHPDVLVLIVGGIARHGEDYTKVIEDRIAKHGIADNVRLVGSLPPQELPKWYSAATISALMTSREGCPNAVTESLACGLPVVATPIGEIPYLVNDPALGVVLKERTAEEAARGITVALSTEWDRTVIRKSFENRSWHQTATEVNRVFREVLRKRARRT